MAKKRKIDDEKSAEGAPAEKKEKIEKWLKVDSEAATTTEKKKKRPWRNKPEVVEKKDDVAEDSEVADKIADAKKRLDAGRF
ncbi:hypothetical protein GCK72_016239 [Caenorhabditis remanei]|uniref:Uncharacterized protein n=1 Tax=Caenorhabditis remanei TaxID=31234 RepID=A0A2P4VC46_CAERE|nr:hypothetical protein GCK72_016239 [Caenorhabditis remanei]KAF1759772.1 hypothetical protein GCK72_016239 [Caenorhabditis remanei]